MANGQMPGHDTHIPSVCRSNSGSPASGACPGGRRRPYTCWSSGVCRSSDITHASVTGTGMGGALLAHRVGTMAVAWSCAEELRPDTVVYVEESISADAP